MKLAVTILTMAVVSSLGFVWCTSAAATIRQEHKEIKLDPKIYDTYAGEYSVEFGPNDALTILITRDGDKLMGQANGKPKIQLFPETETRFFAKVADLQVTFFVEKNGKVSHLTFADSGKTIEAKKVK